MSNATRFLQGHAPPFVIPTRNRPREIGDFLGFIANFYPKTVLLVADGSAPHIQPAVQETCMAYAGRLQLEYRSYPENIGLFERLTDAVESLDSEIIAISADDDFPLVENYAKAARQLAQKDTYSCVVPYDVVLNLGPGGTLDASLSFSRSITAGSVAKRVESYAQMTYATSYGACRKNALLSRYRNLSRHMAAGFVDYQIGLIDCIEGKIGALDALGSIRTHRVGGTYIRPPNRLSFLEGAQDVLGVSSLLVELLVKTEELDFDEAERLVRSSLARRISELINGDDRRYSNFFSSDLFRDERLQQQFTDFYGLFSNRTAIRDQYFGKIKAVFDILQRQAVELQSPSELNSCADQPARRRPQMETPMSGLSARVTASGRIVKRIQVDPDTLLELI
jgi:glycosyltransferase domain-containing protein